jgi:hypothetical protein
MPKIARITQAFDLDACGRIKPPWFPALWRREPMREAMGSYLVMGTLLIKPGFS